MRCCLRVVQNSTESSGISDFEKIKQDNNDQMQQEHKAVELIPSTENGWLLHFGRIGFGIRHYIQAFDLQR